MMGAKEYVEAGIWALGFFSKVCKFYKLSKEPRLVIDDIVSSRGYKTLGQFSPEEWEVTIDKSFFMERSRDAIARVIVHELTHAWQWAQYDLPWDFVDSFVYTRLAREYYFDEGNPIEERERLAAKGYDVRKMHLYATSNLQAYYALCEDDDTAGFDMIAHDLREGAKHGRFLPEDILKEMYPDW